MCWYWGFFMCILCFSAQSREQKKPFPKHPPGSLQKPYKGPWDYLNWREYEITDFYRHADPVGKQAFKQRAAAQRNFPMPGFPKGAQTFFWDDDEDKYSGYIVRVPYRHLRTSQEWHDWDSLYKRFDPSTRTWDLFPEPIPHTVLHYSHLLSANSPSHPPPSLPIASGDILPHESTWDHYGSSLPVVFIEDYDLPTTSSIVPSPPININEDRVSLWDKDKDSYPTMESDSILPPSVTTTSHMEWECSSNDHKWQEVPSLDHPGSVDVEASYRFSDHWDILDNLYERFGFTIDSTAQITWEQPVSNQEWADYQKWIGYHKSTSLPSIQITSIHQFLSSLVANEWNLSFLEGIAEHDIAINTTFPLDQHQEDAFSILPNKLNDGSLCYVIDNNDPSISNWWSLILTDPMTVLQCMCMNFNGSLKNMACYLFYSGRKFNTCILHDPPKNDDLPYWPLSLGWHPSEYESKPTTGDYGEYQVTLDCLFSRP